MTTYQITYDPHAAELTGLPWLVSCIVDGSAIWHQYCKTRLEAELLTGEG